MKIDPDYAAFIRRREDFRDEYCPHEDDRVELCPFGCGEEPEECMCSDEVKHGSPFIPPY